MIDSNDKRLLAEVGLSAEAIERELARKGIDVPMIDVVWESASTNRTAEEYSRTHSETAVFIADGQTAGRGRRGRNFASPHGAGIYMSILLCPRENLSDLTAVTTFTAVAVCRAIQRVCGLSADIKWVNDVYYGGKKLGGILTEGALAEDMKTARYVIVGIGLNVLRADMPEELRDIALSIEEASDRACDRNLLIAEIIAEFIVNKDGEKDADTTAVTTEDDSDVVIPEGDSVFKTDDFEIIYTSTEYKGESIMLIRLSTVKLSDKQLSCWIDKIEVDGTALEGKNDYLIATLDTKVVNGTVIITSSDFAEDVDLKAISEVKLHLTVTDKNDPKYSESSTITVTI